MQDYFRFSNKIFFDFFLLILNRLPIMLMKNHTKKNQEKSITEFQYTIRLMGNWKVILLTQNTITFNVYWDICGLCDHT